MSDKAQTIKNIFFYSSSAYFSQGITLVSGIFIAKVLGPERFGEWNILLLILSYGAYLDLGVISAVGRDLPFYLGNGDTQKSYLIDGAARYVTFFSSIIASIILISFSFLYNDSSNLIFGIRIMAFVLILQQVYTYHRIILRSYEKFGELSLQQFLFSLSSAILAVFLVVYGGYKGRLLALILAHCLIIIFALYRNPWRKVNFPKYELVLSLIKIGFPILITGLIITLLNTVDRLIANTFLDKMQVGFMGLSLMLVSVISLIPAAVSQVLLPRINFKFGIAQKDTSVLKSLILTPPIILSNLLPILIGTLFLILPYVVKTFLPEYIPATLSARIVVLGIYFYGILGSTDNFLITTGRLKIYALFGIIALFFNISIDFIFIKYGYGINGIAFGGTVLTYFLYSSLLIGYAANHFFVFLNEFASYFIKLWLPFVYMLFVLIFVDYFLIKLFPFLGLFNSMFFLILKLFIYWIACIPLLSNVLKEINVPIKDIFKFR